LANDAKKLTICMVGDVYVSRDDPRSVFRKVSAELRKSTFLFGNLETPCCDGGTLWPKGGMGYWKADARQLEALSDAGFHAVGATNNHILNYGHDGLLETLSHLDERGIKYAGAGRNEAEAYAPAIVEREGCRVALLAYTSVFTPGWEASEDGPGLAVIRIHTSFEPHPRHYETPGKPPKVRSSVIPADRQRVARDIAAARAKADIVVCSFHWGVSEGYEKLTEYQEELGHFAIDSGADIVFGHHPHLIQGIEIHKGKPIFYSVGNFTFAAQKPHRGHELDNIMARCIVRDRRVVEIQYVPVRTDARLDPEFVRPENAPEITGLVERRSKAFNTRFYAAGDAVGVEV
jgi:poly-gamma-glutamate synthesis protein (capsule biosynthesis protein)